MFICMYQFHSAYTDLDEIWQGDCDSSVHYGSRKYPASRSMSAKGGTLPIRQNCFLIMLTPGLFVPFMQ
jgi:hypothetical protein